jgi:hypothetical protein
MSAAILLACRIGKAPGSVVDPPFLPGVSPSHRLNLGDRNHDGAYRETTHRTAAELHRIGFEMRSANNLVGAKIQPDFAFGGRGTVGSVR